VRAEGGDSYYSLSEVQVFCETPSAWPPPATVKNTSSWWWKKILEKRDHRYRFGIALLGLFFFIALFRVEDSKKALWVASALSVAMVAIASYRLYGARLAPWFASWGVYVLGALVVAWAARGIWLAKQDQEARLWLERGALIWVIVACATAWVNFGVFHRSRIVHYWDTFHYYVGSKYFEENEYERLYECVLAVDYEDRGEADKRTFRSERFAISSTIVCTSSARMTFSATKRAAQRTSPPSAGTRFVRIPDRSARSWVPAGGKTC
jgi:hypothetical protein